MVNYKLRFSLAEVAKIFAVDKKVVRDWIYYFSEYLSKTSNPPKGVQRSFQLEDIRVMAYVFYYWEEDADVEYIKMGLNSNSHFENDLIDNMLIGLTPIFIDVPENIDESWKHGVVLTGLSQFADTFYLANSYKIAGDKLIDSALENEDGYKLYCPAIYNYRHATELYLKAITNHNIQTHNLVPLFDRFKKLLSTDYNTIIPQWFQDIIHVFNDFDPGGTAFRYGGNINQDEVFVDFIQLKKMMTWMEQSFQNIRRHQGMPDAKL